MSNTPLRSSALVARPTSLPRVAPAPWAGGEVDAAACLDALIAQALEWQASDIHFEPLEHGLRVRCRVDGRLRLLDPPPAALRERLLSRLKVLARLDIAERRLAQDGQMDWSQPGQTVHLRVSTLPTLHGEKIVLRVLDTRQLPLSLPALGYSARDLHTLTQALARPHGLVLLTGPTGSGKTASLYSCLTHLQHEAVNIASVEDPSEIPLEGINQVSVNERAGLSFAHALRALLRQDPDILMVGEMRDTETAGIALQAAQTGHLVLSTLHSNDAPSALWRLMQLGLDRTQIAHTVHLIVAQRLVRRLCTHCRVPPDTLNSAWQARGCAACHEGYRGRIGLFQVMPISTRMQGLISAGADVQTLAQQAREEGVRSVYEDGCDKAQAGHTDLHEVRSAAHAHP
ncbi:MAG: type II/IV secretion system protein [Limnohabitans sp.]|jgi:type IV pilus assembly protein PilB|nr:type II/IV secretion system protein [Limnohabitans sp.]